MEDLSLAMEVPGSVIRPKSLCVPDLRYLKHLQLGSSVASFRNIQTLNGDSVANDFNNHQYQSVAYGHKFSTKISAETYSNNNNNANNTRRPRVRRIHTQRNTSRLYRANVDPPNHSSSCVGPEFVVRASQLSKEIIMPDFKGHSKRRVTVVLLNGQKLDVLCNPNTTTTGQLFEVSSN